MTPERFERYIRARDNNECQLQLPGCTHTCDLIGHTRPLEQLATLNRDPDSPDNNACICRRCAGLPDLPAYHIIGAAAGVRDPVAGSSNPTYSWQAAATGTNTPPNTGQASITMWYSAAAVGSAPYSGGL